ncbi:MIER1 transcriptional regulator [Phyllostomus discolor]|uniref:MIER1 transcriptional regulator n=1 Tax=Phyllostomus discolor TaxID=89673 RepID=A0A834EAV8_9CHIR|nr:MIER1 transcriptional regulator [Phyllostomus discolor]
MFARCHGDGGAQAQQAAARLAGGWRPRRRAEAEGRAEGWRSKRKLGETTRRRRLEAPAQSPSQALSLPGCRRMDGDSSGGGGSSEGGGGSGGGSYGVVARFSQCLAEFRTWLRTNWLRFNADKTDVML